MVDNIENQTMAGDLVYQILERYSQKITLDPTAIDELTDKERDFLRMVWQAKTVDEIIEASPELEEMDDKELSEQFHKLKVIDGKIQ